MKITGKIMKRHVNGYIVHGPDFIDIDLWRKRLREDYIHYKRQLEILTKLLDIAKQKLNSLKR